MRSAIRRIGRRPLFAVLTAPLALAALGASLGWSAVNPVTGETLVAKSLVSEELVRQLLTEMPRTYTGFTPLGLALLIMLGAGVAEQAGLLSALIRKAARAIPDKVLAPAVILLGMLTVHGLVNTLGSSIVTSYMIVLASRMV